MRHELRETDIREKSRIKEVSEFLRPVLPEPTVQPPPPPAQQQSIVQPEVGVERTPPPPSQPQPFSREGEEEISSEISDNADYVSAPYTMPSLLDTKYGIRKNGDIHDRRFSDVREY
jgi:hypothetical protein